jgi:methylated-DNA-[protein]-cysteine S-methyltransferase
MIYYATYASPLGELLLTADADTLVGLYFVGQRHFRAIDGSWREDASAVAIARARRELDRYFGGEPVRFTVPLSLQGTAFQRAAWRAIASVGYGETISYAELAHRAGFPGSPRAAGVATGRNPVGIIVPCHRIVGANGELRGYAGGLERKRALLALERDGRNKRSATAA